MNINLVKLPLIRVAHPSQMECEQEYEKIRSQIDPRDTRTKTRGDNRFDLEDSENLGPNIKAASTSNQYTPNLFNFDHPYDPDLTPRKKWKERVTNLDSIIAQEQEKYRQLEIKQIEEKQKFESELVNLNSQLKES